MIKSTGYTIKKKLSIWNQPLDFDFKAMLQAITNGTIHGITMKWDDLAKDLLDAGMALGFKNDPAQLTWLLICRSLSKAVFNLIQENKNSLNSLTEIDRKAFNNILYDSINDEEVIIDHNFFNNPKDLSILNSIKILLTEWLCSYGVSKYQCLTIADHLPSYFVLALNEEWRERNNNYEIIKNTIETPFTKASEKELCWFKYSAWLQKLIEEPMFGETVSLRQVYVPLRAAYEKNVDIKNKDFDLTKSQKILEVIDLDNELDHWVINSGVDDTLRVLCGGPGFGKSSISKFFAAKQSAKNVSTVMYIPLHLLDMNINLIDAIKQILPYYGLPAEVIELKQMTQPFLIIFDGLDELAMQGKAAVNIAKTFIDELRITINRYNQTELRLRALVTGRDIVVQACSSSLKNTRQILHLLKYNLSFQERGQYNDPNSLLEIDQRIEWWQKFGIAYGENIDTLPNEFNHPNLNEITSLPLLNYLVALTRNHNTIDFSSKTTRSEIYENLIRVVYERSYAGHNNQLVGDLSIDEFLLMLEEIGLAIWHGDMNTATETTIKVYCEEAILERFFQNIEKGSGVTQLLAAFYFRESGKYEGTEKTFEFTHKTFGEYLIARRLVRALNDISEGIRQKRPFAWDYPDALAHWIRLCGPTVMDEYLYSFLIGELSRKENKILLGWQQDLVNLISYVIQNDYPVERAINRLIFKEERRQVRNSIEALLAAHSACARITNSISNLSSNKFGDFIVKLYLHRPLYEKNVLAIKCLNNLLIDNCSLNSLDFFGADLSNSSLYGSILNNVTADEANFKSCNMEKSILERANLAKANLESVNLRHANLKQANLEHAILFRADLQEALIPEASLQGANLSRANLFYANLQKSVLDEANLEEATLQGAELYQASLQRTNLRKVFLQKAKLQDTNFKRADLTDANLQEALLIGSNFFRAKLSGANLSEAHLTKANLNEADLQRVNLQGAFLQEAKLKEVNLREANLQEAKLLGANLFKADLRDANLNRVNMQDSNLMGAFLIGSDLRGANLKNTNLQEASLTGVNLQETNLQGANLIRADLREVDLTGTILLEMNLQEALLSGAKLSNVNLKNSNLQGANLQGANLEGANLIGANLQGADLMQTNLRGANFINANIYRANFKGADIQDAKGL